MSAPSTISAIVPVTPLYVFSDHRAYHEDASFYGPNRAMTNGASRPVPSYKSIPSSTPVTITRTSTNLSSSRQPPATTISSQSDSILQGPRKGDRRPDWHEFYKNGPPKEIIVIDDDSPTPQKRVENTRINHTTRTLMKTDMATHTNKKRKTAQAPTNESVGYQQASYAKDRSDGDTGSDTISTDRTTSLQTTAPTSLGSSLGSSGTYPETAVTGQKRKRVTRQQTADEKKRREIEVVGDAYSSYVPPPKPPIKAKDIYCPPVRDVNIPFRSFDDLLTNDHRRCQTQKRSMIRMGIILSSRIPSWGKDVSLLPWSHVGVCILSHRRSSFATTGSGNIRKSG